MPSLDPKAQQRNDALTSIFAPRSVAIVGASDIATKVGGIPVHYHKSFGFDGPIYPVNPKGGELQGLRAYPSLQAIGAPIDVAIFALPASRVSDALDDAIAAGVRGIVLFSSGYAEVSDDGLVAQEALAAKARAAGIRLLGPNCLGLMNIRTGVYATFSPALYAGLVQAGSIGMVSQSGAFAAYAYALARERGIGLSQWITTGNEADIDLADCIEWLAHDPDTRVIMAYMEGCRDGFKLRRALAAAHAARKPVVIVKVGRTVIGARAAASHTAALAGDDAVYDAVFREYGVHRARDVAEFFGIAASASIATLPPDRTIGLFTLSGGVGVLMADEAHDSGLEVRPMPQQAQDTIRTWVPFANPVNPVDITGQVTNDLSLIERSARLMLEVGGYGSWIGFMAAAGTSNAFWPVIESLVDKLRRDFPDKLLALSTLLSLERRHALESRGCLVFSEPAEAVRTIGALAAYAEAFSRSDILPPQLSPTTCPLPAGPQSEPQALATLAAAGIATCAHEVVACGPAAVAAAQRLAQPVVMKIVSPDILHKSDIGGVALGLRDADAVQLAYDTMLDSVRTHAPTARIDGVLVAPMVQGGVECILGARRDPVFGPMVMFGLGGVFVELLGDVALHSAPVDHGQAMAMIRSVKGFGLLSGARGRTPVDLAHLANNLVALSQLAVAAGDTLDSIDINPFIARPAADGGGSAVDAVVVGREPSAGANT
jgi:acetate---CoA ligase (ADP-forming)